jgi:uncharacterized protein with HEPN domain
MRDAASRAIEVASGLNREDLSPDAVETLALIRLVEIIGEASRRVPEEVRRSHSEVPWRQIAGARDRLIHGYDEVDLDILWNIVSDQLPQLIARIDAALKRAGDG